MKKGWKIALISLGSLLGLVVIAVVVVLWLVFTPSQLTKIVNSLSGKFLTCETYFECVDLTLLSTFPDAGLKVENVYLVNPVEGAPSDTLARIGSVTVGLDVKAFLKENRVEVHQVIVDDALANVYIAPDGKGNFDIVKPSDKNDTSESDTKFPELIDLKKIKIKHLNAHFKDEKDGLEAKLSDFDLALKGTMKDEMVDALLNVVNLEIHGNRPVTYVRMRGLKPGALYRDEENGRVYPSDALMETGLPMPVPSGDYDSIQIILKKLA